MESIDGIESIESNLEQIDATNNTSLSDLLTSIHRLLNTLNIQFNISKYISLVNKILLIQVNYNNWNIIHEIFDIALLGCIMFASNDSVFWAKWVYNKLLWKKDTLLFVNMNEIDDYISNYRSSINNINNIDAIKSIQVFSKTNPCVNALYMLRLIFVKDSYDTTDEIIDERAKAQKALIVLNTTIDDWIHNPLIEPIFYNPIFSKFAGYNLTYHNCNNALLLHQYAVFYGKMMSKLYKQFGGLNRLSINNINRRDISRKKIGFISRFLYKHSVGKVSIGIIEQLYKRNEFDIYVYTSFERDDPYCNLLKANCHKFYSFTKEGQLDWINHIQNDTIDILIFLDPLMDINTYLLASFRITPIQIAYWGHPDTTGLPTIDYYISSKIFEKYTDNNYTETLIRFNSMNYYYYDPNKFLEYNIYTMLYNYGKNNARAFLIFHQIHVYMG
jgi:hypothetical protein